MAQKAVCELLSRLGADCGIDVVRGDKQDGCASHLNCRATIEGASSRPIRKITLIEGWMRAAGWPPLKKEPRHRAGAEFQEKVTHTPK